MFTDCWGYTVEAWSWAAGRFYNLVPFRFGEPKNLPRHGTHPKCKGSPNLRSTGCAKSPALCYNFQAIFKLWSRSVAEFGRSFSLRKLFLQVTAVYGWRQNRFEIPSIVQIATIDSPLWPCAHAFLNGFEDFFVQDVPMLVYVGTPEEEFYQDTWQDCPPALISLATGAFSLHSNTDPIRQSGRWTRQRRGC